ncbi:GGDEF domain-containing protein [Vibrio sinaloensis]|uniref:GGDEF domain-containing protein n=1 Tax=Photobacterium sp. (strain ATCC 43367) TaxID=379097 RepID=UPI0022AE6071|nr:GGDEF domain-containing protein [Vibrio sinaloensis]MCZ4296251.1 GGDEF domain-containing protein [Vibrio sinaloensis]
MSFSVVTTNWFRIALPLLLLTFIAFGMDNVVRLTQANLGFVTKMPFVLFATAILLANPFKQSRIAMTASALAVAYWLIQNRLQSPLSSGTTILELSLLAALLPIALVLVFSYKDSNLFSRSFAIYLVKLGLFVMWCYLILTHFYDGGFDDINETFLFVIPTVSKLPFILVVYLLAMVLIFAICVLSQNRIIDVVLYSSALLASTTFVFFHIPHISSTMFSLAGILLLVYLLSASYELAFKDTLTDIPGRLALESDLRHLGRRYTIAMLDIDHFKSFNDTYGHDTGDDVLKLVASRLQLVGGRAKVYRYGGEEFTVLFKGKLADEAQDHLELLRASIESYEMTLRNQDSRPKSDKLGSKKRGPKKNQDSVNVTISIGVADSSETKDVYTVMKSADAALYKAKKSGRNQVCLA